MNFWYSHLFRMYTVFIGNNHKLIPFCVRQRTVLQAATLSSKTKLSHLEPQGSELQLLPSQPRGLKRVRASPANPHLAPGGAFSLPEHHRARSFAVTLPSSAHSPPTAASTQQTLSCTAYFAGRPSDRSTAALSRTRARAPLRPAHSRKWDWRGWQPIGCSLEQLGSLPEAVGRTSSSSQRTYCGCRGNCPVTSQELAAGKLEGFLELRHGPEGLRQSRFLLPPGLALCTLGVRRWSARRGSAAATGAVGVRGRGGPGSEAFAAQPAEKGFLI
jgi:hypothetical protein